MQTYDLLQKHSRILKDRNQDTRIVLFAKGKNYLLEEEELILTSYKT